MTSMKSRPLVIVGAILYALAWWLPVIRDGRSLGSGTLPGWEAFRVSVASIWPYEGVAASPWYWNVLDATSGLTNVFLIASVLGVFLVPNRPHPIFRTTLFVCAVLNTQWFVLHGDRGDFRIGYYLWVASFFVIAAGVARNRRGSPATARAR